MIASKLVMTGAVLSIVALVLANVKPTASMPENFKAAVGLVFLVGAAMVVTGTLLAIWTA